MAIAALQSGQRRVTDALAPRGVESARKFQKGIDSAQRRAEKTWPLDATVLNLGGYHRKNAYMVKHWATIEAGRPPKDPVLVQAERFFFDTLFVNPIDFSALNGLGNVLYFERDFEAAEFFTRRAIDHAERAGIVYAEAEHDLELIRRHLDRR